MSARSDVYFQSVTSLRSFMEAKEEAEEDMKQAVLSLLESSCHTQPCPAISVNALLYLMHPRKDNPQLFLGSPYCTCSSDGVNVGNVSEP